MLSAKSMNVFAKHGELRLSSGLRWAVTEREERYPRESWKTQPFHHKITAAMNNYFSELPLQIHTSGGSR
jgi:hypothetical protein